MDRLKWIKVTSTNIHSIAYDLNNCYLYVRFNNESIYLYYNVDDNIFDSLLKADSKGKFLATYIKKNYKYIRIQ